MTELSAFALRHALAALIAERKSIERRLETATPEEDEDEHLSETVLDIQRAIGEIGSAYAERSRIEPGQMDLQSLVYSLESAD